jgi:putative resolvase
MGYVRIAEASQYFGVCSKTLLRWEAAGQLQVKRTPGNQRLYDLSDVHPTIKEPVIYARVSSFKQKNDMERQIQYLLSKYPGHSVVRDVGSGLNFKRKGLLSLLERVEKGLISQVVVASKDRLCRFGFDLLSWNFQRHGVDLVVLDQEDKSPEAELAEDVLAVVQVFACRWNGKRRYRGRAGTHKDQEDQTAAEPKPEEAARCMEARS